MTPRRRDRSKMTPAQKAWDTRHAPDTKPEKTQAQKTAFLYGNIYRMGFGTFSERNARNGGYYHEFVVTKTAFLELLKRLEQEA